MDTQNLGIAPAVFSWWSMHMAEKLTVTDSKVWKWTAMCIFCFKNQPTSPKSFFISLSLLLQKDVLSLKAVTPSLVFKTWNKWLSTSQRRLLVQEDGAQVCTSIVFPIPSTSEKICGQGRNRDGVMTASVPWALYVKAWRGKMILWQNLEQVLDTVVSVLGWHSLLQCLKPLLWSPAPPFVKENGVSSSCLCIGLSACMGHDPGALFPSVRAEWFKREWPWGVFLTVMWYRSYHQVPYLCLFIPS